jgi:arabinogalactan endo-1,4-beta-galactosidase
MTGTTFNNCTYRVFVLLLTGLSITAQHGVCAEFMRGADISIQTRQEADGVIYKEYGVPKDALTIFKNHNFNWIRIRLFHTPSGSEYGVCQDLAYVTTLAARVKADGFKFLLDIHYSDTWADPSHQTIPAAWAGMSHSQLVTAVHDYTRDVITTLRTNNAMPEMVQIGNEIICGMLWPDGEVCNGYSNWSNLADLINAGISGVNDGRGAEPMPEIMIHIDRGGDPASTQSFFDNLIARGVQFDVIGQSFYPEWHGTLDELTANLNFMAGRYSQDIIIAETAEYYTGSTGKTPENQKAFLEELIQRVQATPNGKGRGVCYWEPTWVWNSGVGYKALFEPNPAWNNVNMLMGMEAFDISGDVTPPSPPTGLTATGGAGIVSLDWNDNNETDLAGYNVYRSLTSGGAYTKVNPSILSSSNYIDGNVVGGTTYYYVVTAVDTSSNSNESNDSSEASAVPNSGIRTVYNFAGINAANTNYNAYACDVDVFPFASNSANRNSMVEATDSQYVNISANDTSEWATADPGSNDEIFLWIEMKINELPADITKIALTFDGNTGGSIAATHRIFVLTADANWTLDASWTKVGSDQSFAPGVYSAMTRSIVSNISNYIDANGKIVWGAYETTSSEMMHVNYLEMAVTIASDSPPTVSITSPLNGAIFAQDANITIDANASDTDGAVTKVEFFQGTTKLGEDANSPYSYTWNSVPTGYYSLTAKATDDDGNSTTSSPVGITSLGAVGTGAVLCEWWTGIPGTAVSDLTSDANYPDSPSGEELLITLEGPTNWADDYGTRIRGYLNPVISGDYTFWIASDANSELWLSTNDNPANAVLIASVPANPQSSLIPLVAGQKYYIEVLHKEGTGNDNISVSWEGPWVAQQVINGVYLSPCCLEFINFADFAAQWNRSDCNVGNDWCDAFDFNRDGSVLLDDLMAFVNNWLTGIE